MLKSACTSSYFRNTFGLCQMMDYIIYIYIYLFKKKKSKIILIDGSTESFLESV